MTNPTITLTPRVSPTQLDWVKAMLGVTATGLVLYAYCVQPAEGTATTYEWLTGHWRNISHYSHGPLIPFIASGLLWWILSEHRLEPELAWRWFGLSCALAATICYFADQGMWRLVKMPVVLAALGWQVWVLRRRIAEHAGPPSAWGVGLLALAMAVYYLGIKAVQPRLAVFSFIMVLYSLALALGGRGVMRVLFFPISFLFLMVPLNFLEERVGVPLRHLVAYVSTALLNTLGIETTRVGTAIHSSVFKFDVADPCSGIRSLMALTTVTAAYAYVTQATQWKRWVLFLSAIPLAVLGNMARVTSIALVAQVYGQELATKAYHDWSGYVVFGVALTAMVGVGALLNVRYRHLWKRWNQPPAAIPTESHP